MKLIFQKNAVCSIVPLLMSGVSSGKETITAVEGILFQATKQDGCTMTTYDMEKGVQIHMTEGVEVIEEGSAVINATKFGQIVRAMEGGSITLTVDDKLRTTVVCGRSSHTMIAQEGRDFPEIPRLTSAHGYVTSQKVLKQMMAKCLFAMGVNDQRPVLNGLFMNISENHLDMVACDSFKMAVCSASTQLQNMNAGGEDLQFRYILPNKSVNELYKLLDDKPDENQEEKQARIYMSKKNTIVVLDHLTFFTKLIDGEYVDYNRIIIRNHKICMTLDRECFLGALERAALVTEQKVAGAVRSHVKLQLEGGVLKISATSGAGSSYDELPVAHEGEDIVIAFNNRYLMECLRACRADTIKVSMTSALTSMNIEPADPETDEEGHVVGSDLFFLLPVRMKD